MAQMTGVCQLDKEVTARIEFSLMKKNSQFTLRIPAGLKVQLEEIASSEGRSTAQICEVFLKAGVSVYKKKGTAFISDFLTQQKRQHAE